MGFRLSDVVTFEERHMVHSNELNFVDEDESEATLPPAKRAMPTRTVS
jgi:hypothetical protein